MRALRRTYATAAITALLLSLTACGGDGEEPAADSGDTPTTAESSPEGAESSSASEAGETHDVDSILRAMRAAMGDATSARIQMNMTGAAEMSLDGRMAMTEKFEEGEMELRVEFQGQRLDLRLVDGLIYVSGPPLSPPGKWVSADPQDPRDPLGGQFGSLAQSGNLDSTFDAFDAGLREVEHVGEEQIDGETVDHYIFTVDAKAAAKAQGQQWQPGMPEEVTYDVWLTADDLMRRVSFELGPVKAVVDATEWGEPVDVQAPAPGDIVEAPTA